MKKYRYKGLNADGRTVKGSLVAEGPADLEAILKDSNIEIISFKAESEFSLFGNGVVDKDLISLFVYLEQLDRAGVSIIDSIADIKENSESPGVRTVMQQVYESIKNGSLFSEAVSQHPKVFNEIYIGLIKTGEKTGNLADSFDSIIQNLKWNADIKRKKGKAIRMPLFSLLVMFLVLMLMTGLVVPKVTSFLRSQEIELPVYTISLIAFSDFMKANFLLILASIPTIIIAIKMGKKFSPAFAIFVDGLVLYLPVFGGVVTKLESARFCQFFAITFKSGLGIIECIETAGSVIGNKAIKNSIESIKDAVSDGTSINESIANSGYFPPLVNRMFKVGEESGNMESALQNIQFFYDREINDSIDKIVAMIQPTLTIVMGGMIIWIVIAVFGPLYSGFSNFG